MRAGMVSRATGEGRASINLERVCGRFRQTSVSAKNRPERTIFVTHEVCLSRSLNFFISSQTALLPDWFRSRYAGWKVGMSLTP